MNDPAVSTISRVVVPLFFGLVSLWLGADANWDLLNYHWYNAFAWLNGKLAIDFAPSGMQTFFNPLLDLPFYLLNRALPGPLVGFIFGTLHGLNFVLLLAIARRALPHLPAEDVHRLPLLLALAGCLTANFLSGIGNSMGDDTTTLFVLAALLMVLKHVDQLALPGARTMSMVLAAGLCAGLGVGLKLTNAVFALALCLGLLVIVMPWRRRVLLAFVFGCAVLAGIAATGGYWFWQMWTRFHNPLFPQFSALFPNPLASPIGVADTIWLPKNWMEMLFWPFIFSWHPLRVGQQDLHQALWAVLYLALFVWVVRAVYRKARGLPVSAMPVPARYLLAFVVIGYLLWMKLFSIQRYLVPIELCAPLLVFILLHQTVHHQQARRLCQWVLLASTAVVLFGGARTWGHEPWSREAYRAAVPTVPDAAHASVIIVGGDPAYGWLAAFFPVELAFTQVQGSFPEGVPGYRDRVNALTRARGGAVYGILEGHRNWRVGQIARFNDIASTLGISATDTGCGALSWATRRLRLHAQMNAQWSQSGRAPCHLDVVAADLDDLPAKNRQTLLKGAQILAGYGYTLDPGSCTVYLAHVGKTENPYQWCRLDAR